MKITRISMVVSAVALMFGGGCGARQQEITELQRKEAAHLASEAEFAMTLRDYARAESVLTKVVKLCPDTGAYWVSLGSARMRLGNRGRAKEGYEGALRAYEAEARRDKTDVEPWLGQVTVLALLGRVDDGRALLDKIAKQFPGNRTLRAFIERKQLDQMLGDPKFKEIAL
jgi:tetratricopeptide (TPR) repeat protein